MDNVKYLFYFLFMPYVKLLNYFKGEDSYWYSKDSALYQFNSLLLIATVVQVLAFFCTAGFFMLVLKHF